MKKNKKYVANVWLETQNALKEDGSWFMDDELFPNVHEVQTLKFKTLKELNKYIKTNFTLKGASFNTEDSIIEFEPTLMNSKDGHYYETLYISISCIETIDHPVDQDTILKTLKIKEV